MRVLVASTALAGHFTPLLPVMDAIARQGAEILVTGPPGLAPAAEGRGMAFRAGREPPAGEVAAIWEQVPSASRREMSVLVDRELFGRLFTAAMVPTVEGVCRSWAPDLVLREPCEYASAVVADRLGIPFATVAISQAHVEASVLPLVAPVLEPHRAGLADRIFEAPFVTRFPESLDPSPFPETIRYREVEADGEAGPDPDWWGPQDRDLPLVYVTFGSVAGGLPVGVTTLAAAVEAVGGLPVRALLTLGSGADPDALGALPPNVHAEAWVPQSAVLRRAAAVVCHGGSGTTFGALAAGVPLVIVPLFADQPTNAAVAATAGAAVVVAPERGEDGGMVGIGPGDVGRLRAAIREVLSEPRYRESAASVASGVASMPGTDEVAARLLARAG